MIIDRNLLKIKLTKEEVSDKKFHELQQKAKTKYGLLDEEVNYFVYKSTAVNSIIRKYKKLL